MRSSMDLRCARYSIRVGIGITRIRSTVGRYHTVLAKKKLSHYVTNIWDACDALIFLHFLSGHGIFHHSSFDDLMGPLPSANLLPSSQTRAVYVLSRMTLLTQPKTPPCKVLSRSRYIAPLLSEPSRIRAMTPRALRSHREIEPEAQMLQSLSYGL